MFNNNKKQRLDRVGIVDLHGATKILQEIIQEPQIFGEERAAQNKQVLEDAMAGVPGANLQAQELIEALLDENGIEVEGMGKKQAAYEIYEYAWGMSVIEEAYRDPKVNEIRVNTRDHIYVLRNIKAERLDGVSFRDDEHIKKIITRITMHDQGVALNRSCPTIECMMRDGTRITATCPPVTKNTTFVLRKHPNRLITPEEMIAFGEMDEKTWDILKTLVKGRANILISGGTGSGKTTLLRTTVSEINLSSRIIVLGSDNELKLQEYFPDRDIIEFEEHKETKPPRDLGYLFRTGLRYSPVTIILEEFRGTGEAAEATSACIRGHNGMATAHFTSVRKAIEGTAKLLIREGTNLDLKMAVAEVATAFEIVVQMHGDLDRGIIIVESITEVIYDRGNVEYRDIIRWMPHGKDYLDGEWHFKSGISPALIEKLCKYASIDDLKGVGLA